MFSPAALPERDLLEIVKRVFERVYNQKPNAFLMFAFTDYRRKRAEFTFEETELEEVKQMFSGSVSCIYKLPD